MIPFGLIALVVFLLDWGSKALIRSRIPLGAEVKIAPFFSLTHIQNTGIAFGLFQDKNTIFIGVGVVMTVVIALVARKILKEDPFGYYVLAGVLGGAWGNLVDRIFFGRVTDFLDFYWGVHHWPAFNVADSAICVGAVLLVAKNFKK